MVRSTRNPLITVMSGTAVKHPCEYTVKHLRVQIRIGRGPGHAFIRGDNAQQDQDSDKTETI